MVQNLPYTQNFGVGAFTLMPEGMAVWTVSAGPKTTQALAQASVANGNALIPAATASQVGSGCFGLAINGNGMLYIQTGSNTVNGTNQGAVAVSTIGYSNIQVSFSVQMISAQLKTVGLVLQYRTATTAAWTNVTGGVYSHNNVDRVNGQTDNFVNLILPTAAANKSVVQLRWASWAGTQAGNYSGVAIDNISITGTYDRPTYYFRSKQSGNWSNTNTWQMSSNNSTWTDAVFTPNYKSKSITIQTGHNVVLTTIDTLDEVIINGTLTYGDFSGNELAVNNGAGTDIIVNGAFEDSGPNAINFLTGATWAIGTNGTLIRTRSTAPDNWQLKYQGGIAVIPATANWILRKTGTDSPVLSSLGGMYYPNLLIECATMTGWICNGNSCFSGATDYPRIKGSLFIGVNQSGTVNFKNENSFTTAIPVAGNIIVGNGSSLQNCGTGIDVKGNIIIDGILSYGNSGTRKILFSGTTTQTISGNGTINFYNIAVSKTTTPLNLATNISVENSLVLTAGKMLLGNNNLILGPAATITATSNAYIRTNGLGKLVKKYNSTGAAFTFAVGDSLKYTPYTINLTSGSITPNADISVRQVSVREPHFAVCSNYIRKYWEVNVNNITNAAATATYLYADADVELNENDFTALRWSAADSTKIAGTVNKATNTATASGLLKSGNYTVAGIIPHDVCSAATGITADTNCSLRQYYSYGTCWLKLQNNFQQQKLTAISGINSPLTITLYSGSCNGMTKIRKDSIGANDTLIIDTLKLIPGIYFVKVETSGKFQVSVCKFLPVLDFTLSADSLSDGDTLKIINTSKGFSVNAGFLWQFNDCTFFPDDSLQNTCSLTTRGIHPQLKGTFIMDGYHYISLKAVDNNGAIITTVSPELKTVLSGMKTNSCHGTCHDTLPLDPCQYICNGDFEYHSACPQGISEICLTEPWTINDSLGSTCSTPDYFNSCRTCNNISGCVSVPQNMIGYQNSHTLHGGAYAGFIATSYAYYWNPYYLYEYIQQPLKFQLTQGERYHVIMYLSLAERCNYAVGGLQMYFTNGQPQQPTGWRQIVPAFPAQLTTPSPIINDKQNWVLYSADFVAPTSGIDWVTIGVFDPDPPNQPNQPVSGNYMGVNYLPGWDNAYYFIDDVSVTFEPTITASQTQICPGQSSILTVAGGTQYLWNTGQTTQSITVNPSASTTYFCTITSANGCTKIDTVTVGVVGLPTQPQLIGSFHNCVQGASLQYSVVSPPTGWTYNWSFPASETFSNSNPNGPATFNVVWKNPFSAPRVNLIVKGTEPVNGCSNSDTITIYQCCDAGISTYPGTPDYNWLDQTITLVNGITLVGNKKIIINGTVYFDEDLTFDGCTFYMGPFAKAVVKSGRTVTIKRSSVVQSCDKINMWDGFYISDNTATLKILGKSWVQDGRNAVVSQNGGIFQIEESSTFDLNNISLLVKSQGANTASYFKTNFVRCSNAASMLWPYNNNRSYCGVKVDTTTYVLIGPSNTFNKLDVGIYSYKSGVEIIQNTFNNITTAPLQFTKAAIWAIGPGVSLKALNNTFTNCFEGIYCERRMNIQVKNNTFTTIKQNAVYYNGIGPVLNSNTVLVDANIISNAGNGVFAYMPGKSISTISNNNISWTYSVPDTLRYGIKFYGTNSANEKMTIGPMNVVGATYAYKAIGLQNAVLPVVTANTITIANKSGSFTPYGIHLQNCVSAKVKCNNVSTNNNPAPGTGMKSFGIAFEMSENTSLLANNINNIHTAIMAANSCLNSKVFYNNMNYCRYGLVLNAQGIIGQQGNMQQPTNNNWTGCVYDTWSFSSYGGSSALYVQNTTNINPYILFIHFSPNNPLYSAFSRMGGAQNIMQPLNPCAGWPVIASVQSAQLTDIAEQGAVGLQATDKAAEYSAERSLRNIVKYDSLMALEPVLDAFYNSTEPTAMGLLDSALAAIREGNCSVAAVLNNRVPDTNVIEANERRVNEIELNHCNGNSPFTEAEVSELRALAQSCPFTDGKAVYRARTLLAIVDSFNTEYLNECEELRIIENRKISTQKAEDTVSENAAIQISIYPNPAAEVINVEVSGIALGVPMSMEVYDVMGVMVKKIGFVNEGMNSILLSEISNGVYFCNLIKGGIILSKNKIVIVK
ncbi:MAG: T9SS type A sorting domain-containing protein [Bacteroidota bacterium]